jgi:hypothetical protein
MCHPDYLARPRFRISVHSPFHPLGLYTLGHCTPTLHQHPAIQLAPSPVCPRTIPRPLASEVYSRRHSMVRSGAALFHYSIIAHRNAMRPWILSDCSQSLSLTTISIFLNVRSQLRIFNSVIVNLQLLIPTGNSTYNTWFTPDAFAKRLGISRRV